MLINGTCFWLPRMRTGCRGFSRRWCWSWSATLSPPSSTPWLRATPSACSSRGTRRRKPSDDETKRYKHPSDCVSAAAADSPLLSPSHSQQTSPPHPFSEAQCSKTTRHYLSVCVCAFEDVCAVLLFVPLLQVL